MTERDDFFRVKPIAQDDKEWYDLLLGDVVIATISRAELENGSPTLAGAQAAADRLARVGQSNGQTA